MHPHPENHPSRFRFLSSRSLKRFFADDSSDVLPLGDQLVAVAGREFERHAIAFHGDHLRGCDHGVARRSGRQVLKIERNAD